ncbi:hypothetical protein T35B1_18598 [Salinisphaera shabanensis T35B1]|uniref:hypothetical protein n=1 Tax=Salinisphaera shabanensis TaxID=180542 RepID=UPI003341FBE4
MTPAQNMWVMIFTFAPALALVIYKNWWVGLLALVSTLILSWALAFSVSSRLSANFMAIWAWLKPPMVAAVVFCAGWFYF